MAEFWRALKTLKALQAEPARQAQQALGTPPALAPPPLEKHPNGPAAQPPLAHRLRPDEPEHGAGHQLDSLPSTPLVPGGALHEPAAPWLPNEPERGAGHRLDYLPSTSPVPIRAPHEPAAPRLPNEPERHSASAPEPRLEYLLPDRPAPGALHESPAARTPNEPGQRADPGNERTRPAQADRNRTNPSRCPPAPAAVARAGARTIGRTRPGRNEE
jgi:hypothetical protein